MEEKERNSGHAEADSSIMPAASEVPTSTDAETDANEVEQGVDSSTCVDASTEVDVAEQVLDSLDQGIGVIDSSADLEDGSSQDEDQEKTAGNRPDATTETDVKKTISAESSAHDKIQHRPLGTFFRAYIRSLLSVDDTAIMVVPPMRTALLLACEWILWGIGNPNTTAFQLGALYVALLDPSGNLSKRLHYMGLTEICVVFIGAVIPSLVWDRKWLDFVVGIPIAYITGLSPLLGSPALQQALKLSTALFAINGAINRNINGYGGPWVSIFWTFAGATASLVLALLPEILGNRDAVRTDLFKVWHGFGKSTKAWSRNWSTKEHIQSAPIPIITMAVRKTTNNILKVTTEDPQAKKWLLSIMKSADRIRELSLCLANGSHQNFLCRSTPSIECISTLEDKETKHESCANPSVQDDKAECYDNFFRSMGDLCNKLALALQFPWAVRYVPLLRRRIFGALTAVQFHGSHLNKLYALSNHDIYRWVPSLVNMLQEELESITKQIMDGTTWPPFSSLSSLPKRVAAAFPPKLPNKLQKDEQRVIHSYAIRFTLAFSVASIPELVLGKGFSAHWFPMTVALIMGPTESATYSKVGDRILGTVLGVGAGSALIPLYEYPAALIVLLALVTCAVCIFFKASYSLFTFFITIWVLTTSAGAGADLGVALLYRICWTFAAEDGRIDPHNLAPALASDIIDAIVVPRVVTLIEDGSADDLMSDFDEETWEDLDRLISRLENEPFTHSVRCLQSARTATSRFDSNWISQRSILTLTVDRSKTVRGPFSNAIATANKRLDKAGFSEPTCDYSSKCPTG